MLRWIIKGQRQRQRQTHCLLLFFAQQSHMATCSTSSSSCSNYSSIFRNDPMNLFLSKKGLSGCFNLKLRCSLRFDAADDDDDDDNNRIDHGFHKGIGLGMRKGKGNPKAIIGNPVLVAPLPLPIPPPPQPLQLLSVFDLETATAPLSQTQIQTPQESSSRRGSPLGFPDRPLPDKVVVAVDVDEVLGNFVSALNRFIADRYSSNHSVSEYHVYEFFKIWNCSRDEADIRVHEFFKTSYFKMGIQPLPGAQRALHKLSRYCNLSIVTSRQNAIKDHTIDWIEKHYPGLFQEIQFGNHFALDGESRPKSEICRSLGAKVLIDDNPKYAIECAEAGIKVLLFDYENSYPWCKIESVNQHPLVTKVYNWDEVEQQLISWIVS
ncbi:hypothetical protein RGQ29_006871 [Quercus rubra]|uniref:Tac7077 n=1 Tax=Quercus rubra TaxID=3512 RepID=A0AAN7ICG7_QUERU|nr:hypothetical protein RGQ29_006871 [Quercus rubra]